MAILVRSQAFVRRRLNGSGLIVVNPPWTLESELKLLLPALADRLADPTRARADGAWSG